MNNLSNRLLSEMCSIKSFFLNVSIEKTEKKPIDRKIFYVFENNKQSSKVGSKQSKKNVSTSTSISKAGSDNKKCKYSLREISQLSIAELKKLIFTFERKLSGDDLTKIQDSNEVNTERI